MVYVPEGLVDLYPLMQFAFHLLRVQESTVVDLLALVVVLLVDAVATGVHQVLVQVVVH